jgi:hypothetical protein
VTRVTELTMTLFQSADCNIVPHHYYHTPPYPQPSGHGLKIAQCTMPLLLSFRAAIFQSVQRWAKGWTIGVLGFDSWRGVGIFLFTTAYRTALGPTQPPIQWISGVLSLGVRWPGREADHSTISSAEAKNAWRYTSTPPTRLHGVVLG